jgi:hypothetical protein
VVDSIRKHVETRPKTRKSKKSWVWLKMGDFYEKWALSAGRGRFVLKRVVGFGKSVTGCEKASKRSKKSVRKVEKHGFVIDSGRFFAKNGRFVLGMYGRTRRSVGRFENGCMGL